MVHRYTPFSDCVCWVIYPRIVSSEIVESGNWSKLAQPLSCSARVLGRGSAGLGGSATTPRYFKPREQVASHVVEACEDRASSPSISSPRLQSAHTCNGIRLLCYGSESSHPKWTTLLRRFRSFSKHITCPKVGRKPCPIHQISPIPDFASHVCYKTLFSVLKVLNFLYFFSFPKL